MGNIDYATEFAEKDVYERIKQLCSERGVSIAWLSKQIGMSKGFLYMFRHSGKRACYRYLASISDVLGMSYDEAFYNYFVPPPTAEEIEELSRLLNMVFEEDTSDI